MATRTRYDHAQPGTKALRDRIVHGAFVTQGTMIAFPTCFPAVTVPLPGDESHLTALDISATGTVYAGASGRACHLLVGMFHGITGLVYDMGTVPGADRVAGICCGEERFLAAVDGPDGGRLVGRRLEPMPFDLIQEWHFVPRPLEITELPCGPEPMIHARATADRTSAVVLTRGHLLAADFADGSARVIAELDGRGRLGPAPDGAMLGLDGTDSLWRFDPASDRCERRAIALPDGDWSTGVIWAEDTHAGLSYLTDGAGRIFALDHTGTIAGPLAQLPLAPVSAMAVTVDGRLFAVAGEGMSRIFCYEPVSAAVSDIGVAVSVFERRRYGYSFADAVVGRDGEIIFAEDDDLGHLWLYFPRILPR